MNTGNYKSKLKNKFYHDKNETTLKTTKSMHKSFQKGQKSVLQQIKSFYCIKQ